MGPCGSGVLTSVLTEMRNGGGPWASRVGMERQDQEHFSLRRTDFSNLHWISSNIKWSNIGEQFPAWRTLGQWGGWLRSALIHLPPGSPRQSRRWETMLEPPIQVGEAGQQTPHSSSHDIVGQDLGMSDSERPPHSGMWLLETLNGLCIPATSLPSPRRTKCSEEARQIGQKEYCWPGQPTSMA